MWYGSAPSILRQTTTMDMIFSDYRNIMKDFGSMKDFDALLKGLHEHKIKLVMDLVVNHSSDEHDWF